MLPDDVLITLADVQRARTRIGDRVRRTPVLRSDLLDATFGARLLFKCENLQEIGAFKARGATNAVFSIPDDRAAAGVATHSSGNHGSAVAWAARLRGVPAYVVMPEGAARPKAAQVERLGGRITYCEATPAAREATTARIVAETGATLVHPFDDLAVMAGQGTAALEFLDETPDLDVFLAPIGGGGLISGCSTAVKGVRPQARVIGVEPLGANDAALSLAAGRLTLPEKVSTIADGLRTPVSPATLAHIRRGVDEVVTVSEAAIVGAMRALWETLRVIVEPSAAVPFAAVREGLVEVRGKTVGVLITGGNVDLDRLPWIVG